MIIASWRGEACTPPRENSDPKGKMVRRFVYLAILSMMAITISTPAAVAQQGSGLCAGAKEGPLPFGSGHFEDQPNDEIRYQFEVSTDKFQLAVDTTVLDEMPQEENVWTYVGVEDSRGQLLASREFVNGEDGILTVHSSAGSLNESFTLISRGYMQYYSITFYECPDGQQPSDGGGQSPDGGVTQPQQPNYNTDSRYYEDIESLYYAMRDPLQVLQVVPYAATHPLQTLEGFQRGVYVLGRANFDLYSSSMPSPQSGSSSADPNTPEAIIEKHKACWNGVGRATSAAGDVAPNPTFRLRHVRPVGSLLGLPEFGKQYKEAANNPACR